jgi:hypothetical protein
VQGWAGLNCCQPRGHLSSHQHMVAYTHRVSGPPPMSQRTPVPQPGEGNQGLGSRPPWPNGAAPPTAPTHCHHTDSWCTAIHNHKEQMEQASGCTTNFHVDPSTQVPFPMEETAEVAGQDPPPPHPRPLCSSGHGGAGSKDGEATVRRRLIAGNEVVSEGMGGAGGSHGRGREQRKVWPPPS